MSHDHHPGSSQERYGPQQSQSSVATSPRAPLDTTLTLTHMTGERLQLFKRLAIRADLDDHHQALGRRVFSAAPEEQMMAMMITVLAAHQHMTAIHQDLSRQILEVRDYASKGGSSTTTNTPWLTKEHGLELRSCIRGMAHLQIGRGDLQSYTAIKNRNGPQGTLPKSFFATVIDAIVSATGEWKKRLLPPRYGKNTNPKHLKAFHTLVNTVCKDIRKEFETNIIENLQLPERITNVGNEKVAKLIDVLVKVHEKHAGSVGGRVQVREDILKKIEHDHLQEACIAYLRIQFCYWGLNKAKYGTRSFWSVVYDQLELLRAQTVRYCYAFVILCLEINNQTFTGKKTFEELRSLTKFELPSKRAIRNMQKDLDEEFPGRLAGNEGDYKGNDQVQVEEDEGDDQENEQVKDDADEA